MNKHWCPSCGGDRSKCDVTGCTCSPQASQPTDATPEPCSVCGRPTGGCCTVMCRCNQQGAGPDACPLHATPEPPQRPECHKYLDRCPACHRSKPKTPQSESLTDGRLREIMEKYPDTIAGTARLRLDLPVLLQASRVAGVRQGLERAAAICDEYGSRWSDEDGKVYVQNDGSRMEMPGERMRAAIILGDAIRALAAQHEADTEGGEAGAPAGGPPVAQGRPVQLCDKCNNMVYSLDEHGCEPTDTQGGSDVR